MARQDPFAGHEGQRFRKRQVEVRAIRYIGEEEPYFEGIPPDWLVDALNHQIHRSAAGGLIIQTLEGPMTLLPGNWLVRGVKGELYPVRADIFAETYEAL